MSNSIGGNGRQNTSSSWDYNANGSVNLNEDTYGDLNQTDNHHTAGEILGNDEAITSLMADIVGDLGLDDASDAFKQDIQALITAEATANQDMPLDQFISKIENIMNEMTQDGNISQPLQNMVTNDILPDDIFANDYSSQGNENTALKEFLTDILTSLANENGGVLDSRNDAAMLAQLLGIEENVATSLIALNNGNIDDIISAVLEANIDAS